MEHALIWHNHEEPLASIHIRLQLVVNRMYAGSATQEEQQLRWRVRVVARFGDIDLPKVV